MRGVRGMRDVRVCGLMQGGTRGARGTRGMRGIRGIRCSAPLRLDTRHAVQDGVQELGAILRHGL